MTSDKGQRFTDRNILGKKILHSKIISFTVFINNQTGAIGGLHAVYSHKKVDSMLEKIVKPDNSNISNKNSMWRR